MQTEVLAKNDLCETLRAEEWYTLVTPFFNLERPMTSAHLHLSIFIVTATLVLSGCAPSAKDKLIGKWQGTIEVDDAKLQQKLGAASNNPIQKAITAKLIEAVKQGTMEFELKADDSFSSSVNLGLLSKDASGTWKVVNDNGNQITVTLTDQEGKVEQTTLTFSEDGSFEIVPDGEAGEVAIFRCRRVAAE